MTHALVVRAVNAWVQLWADAKYVRNSMTRVIRRLLNAKLFHAVAIWRSFIAVQRDIEKDVRLLARFSSRLRHMQSMRIFNSWKEFVDWRIHANTCNAHLE
jgi:hypothetical protein